MTQIPTASRFVVRERDAGRCFRCQAEAHDWHHRRRRNVADGHQHCPCNGLLLCRTCHTWAHRYPRQAREQGYVVASSAKPWLVPIEHFHYGLVLLDHEGCFDLQVTEP